MAGLKVVAVKVLPDGSLDMDDLRAKANLHKKNLAAFMVSISHYYERFRVLYLSDYLSFYLWSLRGWSSRSKLV